MSISDDLGIDLEELRVTLEVHDRAAKNLKAMQEGVSLNRYSAKEFEQWEEEFASKTLDHAQKLRDQGKDAKSISRYFSSRRRRRLTKISDRFKGLLFSAANGEAGEASLDKAAQLLLHNTADKILNSGEPPEALKFPLAFINSPDFVVNAKHILTEQGGTESNHRRAPVTGLSMEDVYRLAIMRTIGISGDDDPTRTTGRWTSPDGAEYEIELMPEFKGNAVLDIIMLARKKNDDGSWDERAYGLQWKSFVKHDAIEHQPEFGYFPEVDSLAIQKIKDLKADDKNLNKHGSRGVMKKAIMAAQTRFLITDTFVDSTAYAQSAVIDQWDYTGKRKSGPMDCTTYSTSLSRPEIHKAITEADPDYLIDQCATLTSEGKVEFHVPVKIAGEDQPVVVKLRTFFSGKLNKEGNVEVTNTAGGKIAADIPMAGWWGAHSIASHSRNTALSWLQASAEDGVTEIEDLKRSWNPVALGSDI
jgi:hypothetical protein